MATVYANYAFYTSSSYYGKAIAEAEFPRLALNASVAIDLLTYGRAAAIVTAAVDTATIEKIKQAVCAVADVLAKLEADGGQIIASESIGRASVTYHQPRTKETQAYNAARLYLGDTGLLYSGYTEAER